MIQRINNYLYYGYSQQSADVHWIVSGLSLEDTGKYVFTAKEAGLVLDEAIDSIFPNDMESCVVPISGGWDSRILLGATMQRFDRSQIRTVSFGAPGQLDFDIGRQISEKFGLEHHAVDLSKVEFTWDNLLASVKESPWTYVPDSYFNRLAVSQVARSDKDVVLSGFMGDPSTGGHVSQANTRDEAIEEFVFKQRRDKSFRLCGLEYDPRSSMPCLPEDSPIPFSELLDFGVRQACCIAPIVTPQKRWEGWGGDMGHMGYTRARVLAPFAHPKWATYWLSVPRELKYGQKLYLDMMKHKFPELSAMPSKYSLGRSGKLGYLVEKSRMLIQNRIDRVFPQLGFRYRAGLNYLDYAQAFRKREDYRAVLDSAIAYLKENVEMPWIDLDKLVKQHMICKSNYENAFLILIGLALNLKVESEK